MKETNHELKEIIRRSGVPIHFLAANMMVSEEIARELLKCKLSDDETFAILEKLTFARRGAKRCRIKPLGREDYDI